VATQLFISHITEEAGIAASLKARMTDDFQVRLAIFLSSDTESIAAGDEWLTSVGAAVRNSAVFIVICTPVSVTRPWVNFEAGAAWMRDIPVIPVCAGGMRPRDLPMPLAARQGLELSDARGLRRLYGRIADAVDCRLPDRDYEALAAELSATAAGRRPAGQGAVAPDNDKAIRARLDEALSHPRYKWRTLDKLAAAAAVPVATATEILRADDRVRFSRGKSGDLIAGLRSRVG
jgi:hypothetical protein